MKPIPGQCDHCDRTATSYYGHWDGGGPGLGEYHSSASCDYHLGDPPGSIPGRCWTCGQAIGSRSHTAGHGVAAIINVHDTCIWPAPGWRGPRQCSYCGEPIAYGQPGRAIERPHANTLYRHQVCPR